MRFRFSGTAIAVLAVAFPISALADLAGYATLPANSTFNLDTATAGTSGGDIQWDGAKINPLGAATLLNFGVLPVGSPAAAYFSQPYVYNFTFSASPLTAGTLTAGDLFFVHTNGGNYAYVQVFAVNSTSITLESNTWGVAAPSGPVITRVQNNYSYSDNGPPQENLPIAPGSLFAVAGSGMATPGSQAVLQDSTKGLPLTLNGASLSVTVNGVTTEPPLYYAIPSQLAAVLPSNTPVGAGTLTLTCNGQTAVAPIQVAPTTLGLATISGLGTGQAIVTDANNKLVTYTNSAAPGQVVTLWGSGLGASTGDSDITYTSAPHDIAVADYPLQVYIGGIPASIDYQGRNGYPGLDQINVTIPAAAPTGCFVSLAAVSGSGDTMVESNHVTIPVAAGGGNCSDASNWISASQAQSWSSKTSINWGTVSLAAQQGFASGSWVYTPEAAFTTIPGSALAPLVAQTAPPSSGSCIAIGPEWTNSASSAAGPFVPTLDAGNIGFAGLGGFEYLGVYDTAFSQTRGFYYAGQSLAASVIPATGTTFTFTAAGGHDVGGFTATLKTPPSLAYTNLGSIGTVTRSQGLTITWTGGGDGVVHFTGGAAPTINGHWVDILEGDFSCAAPASAGQLTVPPYVLAMVPAAAGTVSVWYTPNPQPFSASGLDVGTATFTPVSPSTIYVTFD
jgi:uncharacterized protein (TIGR03437 family)